MRPPRLSLVQSVLAIVASLASITAVVVTMLVTVGPLHLGGGSGSDADSTLAPTASLSEETAVAEGEDVVEVPQPVTIVEVTTDSGLKYMDIVEGTGETPQVGQTVVVHYIGWLADGTKFDSSRDRGSPFTFVLGAGQVIAGWEEGLATMQMGGTRRLKIPPELAYGERPPSTSIPPNETLTFDVELLDIR